MVVGSPQSIADPKTSVEMADLSQMIIGQNRKSHNADQPTGRTCKIMNTADLQLAYTHTDQPHE